MRAKRQNCTVEEVKYRHFSAIPPIREIQEQSPDVNTGVDAVRVHFDLNYIVE